MRSCICLLAVLVCLSLCSCGPKLEGLVRLDSGELTCGQHKLIWRSEATGSAPVACRVYVRFSGTATCEPVFYKPGSDGGRNVVSTAPVAGKDYQQVSERVSQLGFECEGSGDGTCSYEVVKVICHDPENAVTDATSSETAQGLRPKCGDPQVTAWTKPMGKRCDVSVKLSTPPDCPARLTTRHPGGRSLTLDVARNSSALRTVVDVNQIDLKCGETASDSSCLFRVLTTECR